MTALTAQDVADIHEVIARFGHVFDNDEAELMGEVLTADSIVDGTINAGYRIPGLSAAQEFTRKRSPDTPDHNTTDTVVFLDETGTVRARSRYLAPLIDGGIHAGDFFDVLERTPDGWRIGYRISVPRKPVLPVTVPPPEFFDPWRPRAGDVGLRRPTA